MAMKNPNLQQFIRNLHIFLFLTFFRSFSKFESNLFRGIYLAKYCWGWGGCWGKKWKLSKKGEKTRRERGKKDKEGKGERKRGRMIIFTHTFVTIVFCFILSWSFIISDNCMSHQLGEKWLLGKDIEYRWGFRENNKTGEQG